MKMGVRNGKSEYNLNELAEHIKETWKKEWESYVLRTRGKSETFRSAVKWDGGTDSMGRKHKSIWLRAAEIVKGHGLHPERYIRAIFHNQHGSPPLPNILTSESAYHRYENYQTDYAEEIEKALMLQQRECAHQLRKLVLLYSTTYKEALEQILMDKTTAMAGLFRYCVARELGNQFIADYWKDTAMEEYKKSPEVFDLVWKQRIPEDFKNEINN